MLNTILSKTIYEKRWGIFWWTFTMVAFTLMIVLLFPTFRDTFGQALSNVPESIKPILGEANDYQQLNGFLELQVFMQMIFLTFIYGIILFSGLIAGEEGDGTLQSLLVQPVSRTRVYVEKYLAGCVMTFIVSLGMFFATWIGAEMINESVNLYRIFQATFAQWLVSLVFASFAYMLGAMLGRRGLAGGLAGVYSFLAYLVFTLEPTVDVLKVPNYLSPFNYFTNPRILSNGLDASNIITLAVACAVMVASGWVVFRKRDIYQR